MRWPTQYLVQQCLDCIPTSPLCLLTMFLICRKSYMSVQMTVIDTPIFWIGTWSLGSHTVHSAECLLTLARRYGVVGGESSNRSHSGAAEFHVVRAHLSQEVRKAIQQAYRKDKFFEKMSKRKQVNKNFIIYKGLMPLKQEGTMQQLCIPEKL